MFSSCGQKTKNIFTLDYLECLCFVWSACCVDEGGRGGAASVPSTVKVTSPIDPVQRFSARLTDVNCHSGRGKAE